MNVNMTEKTHTKPTFIHNLRNNFLIAMPSLRGSHFSEAVTYICNHDEHGAIGMVLNHVMNFNLNRVFEQFGLPCPSSSYLTPVLAGGPVNMQQGFVLHRDEGQWEASLSVTKGICLTASCDIVAAIAEGSGPSGAQFALGCASWEKGQLEQEMSADHWLAIPANPSIIFDVPVEERREAISAELGIDLNLISPQTGHA